ncbi:MAG: glycosyltransferase family 1 protein [Clostridia bacterium]|nr:glycosyltransferase family 1 protein [Clostridia bacterium]
MKKILQVVSCLERGGTEAFLMNQYRNIDRDKIQFDFFVFREKDYPYLDEIRSMGGNVFFGVPPKSTHLHRFFQTAEKVMREGGYSAVHSHVNLTNAWVLLAAKRANIPVRVSHSHDMHGQGGKLFKRIYRALELSLLKSSANVFLACGKDAGEYLYGAAFFGEHGKVINNGIDVERFLKCDHEKTVSAKESFGLPNDCDLLIGNLTRFESKKNQLFMLEVFDELLKLRPGACLVLGGPDGGMLEQTRQRALELGVSDRVRFIGSRDDVPACLHAFDAVLFPSQFEGLPIALLEAQASGTPCVVSDAVSKEADIGLGKLRFIGLGESPAYWAEELLKTVEKSEPVSDPEILRAFREKGYDVKQSAQELTEVYLHGQKA